MSDIISFNDKFAKKKKDLMDQFYATMTSLKNGSKRDDEENLRLFRDIISIDTDNEFTNYKDYHGTTPLMIAAEKKDQALVSLLLRKGAEVNSKDRRGYSPLFYAIEGKDIDVVKMIIDAGADVTHVNSQKETALIRSVYEGQLEMVKLFVDKYKLDVNAKDNFGNSAISWAAANNGSKFKRKDDVHSKPLLDYLISKNAELTEQTIDMALKYGGDIDTFKSIEKFLTKEDIQVSFNSACYHGKTDLVKYLLGLKADVNKKHKGEYPLQLASKRGKIEVVEILLDEGADVNLPGTYIIDVDESGRTPFMHVLCVDIFMPHIIKKFIDAGVDLNEEADLGKTALDYCVNKENKRILEKLMSKG